MCDEKKNTNEMMICLRRALEFSGSIYRALVYVRKRFCLFAPVSEKDDRTGTIYTAYVSL